MKPIQILRFALLCAGVGLVGSAQSQNFTIDWFTIEGSGHINLRWESVPGRTYGIQWSTNLSNWFDLASGPGVSLRIPASVGTRTEVQLNIPDNESTFYRVKDATFPPDPGTIAPPTNPTEITTIAKSTEFLYAGTDPIQTGVTPGTIQPVRAAVVRGRVLDATGQPLPGVSITIKGHPEFGGTRSRSDGMFDMAANGGGLLTLEYRLTGYLPGQRQVRAPWQDFVIAEDMALIKPDSQVTTIDLANATAIQVARGSLVSDGRGTRTATVLVSPGTQATMTLANGSTVPLPTLSVRATEYTVGHDGPARMPGSLPPTSAYTYAVDLTADEALTAGATRIDFSQPVPFYVDNFLGFPTGIQVPTAYYDSERSAWVPVPDGRVIRILSIDGGIAEVDTTGDGLADNGDSIGMTPTERQALAQSYASDKSLWRVAIKHFTPYDLNYGVVPPDDAKPPLNPAPLSDSTQGGGAGGGGNSAENNTVCGSSIIDSQQQRLREAIPIVGTPFSLYYASDRVSGYTANKTINIPLSDASVSTNLKTIRLGISVAGRQFSYEFPPLPLQSHKFVWDGKNAFGVKVQGSVTAKLRIEYVYDGYYALPPSIPASFGAVSGGRVAGDIPGPDVKLTQVHEVVMGQLPGLFGGWNLGNHHVYEPLSGVLYQGDGRQRRAQDLNEVITGAAGTGTAGFSGDGGPATAARLYAPYSVSAAPDGSLFISDFVNSRIRRVAPNGVITTVAGNGNFDFSGDGGPATNASLNLPRSVAVGSDGSLFIADWSNSRIRRVAPDGIISTVAGVETSGFGGDGGLATAAALSGPFGVALGPDGSIFITDTDNERIRRIGPDGIITTVVGNGTQGFSGDGGPATAAQLFAPRAVAIGPDGSLYFSDSGNNRIRRVTPDGIINTFAGNGGFFGPLGDGGPATNALLSSLTESVAVGPDGSIYIADTGNSCIRRVSSDGIIVTVAGNGSSGIAGDGGLATAARLSSPAAVAVAPDGGLVLAETANNRIRKVAPAWPGFELTEIVVASEDGAEAYVFSSFGRHLRTVNSLTGAVRYSFTYDAAGLLAAIADGDGNSTVIERNVSGIPLAIVSPDGQRTTLENGLQGVLQSVTNPAGEQSKMSYSAGGLLTAFTSPCGCGKTSQYTYDPEGRFLTATSADGHSQSIVRTNDASGYQVTRTTALGRSVNYAVDFLPTAVERRTTTFPDGTTTVVTVNPDGRTTTKYPDGSVAVQTDGPDPRFSMLAPVPQITITTNGPLISTQQVTRVVQLSDSNNPLSLTSLTETRALNGRRSTNTFTAATRTFVTTSPTGRTRTAEIDAQGRPVRVSVPGIADIQNAYDARGRLTNVTQGDRITSFAYDTNGYLRSITDPLGRSVTFTNDAVGRVTAKTGPDGRVISFTYDGNGNLKSLTPPGRPAHTFDYTLGDREAAYHAPDLGDGLNITTNEYNLDRNLERTTLPSGNTIDPAYDGAGRLASVAIGRGNYTYQYDATNGLLKFVTAPDGGGLSNSHQGSLLTGQTWTGAVAGSVTRTYNNDFRVVSRSVNGANTVSNAYDNDRLLVQAGSLALTRDVQNGAVTGSTLGTVTDEYQYNVFGEVTNYTARVSGTPVLTIAYTRDNLGRITVKTETENGATVVFAYAYDLAGQLIEVRRDGVITSTYTYDSNGNRLSRVGPGVNEAGTYDAQDRLLSYGNATYTYTPDGRLRTKNAGGLITTYTYDELGNLVRVDLSNGDVIEYLIDGQNRRIGRVVNGVRERSWLYEGQLRPVAELDSNGNLVSRFVYGTRVNVPEYMIRNGVTYRIVLDHLGSPRLVVDTASGSVAQRLDYGEFGSVFMDTSPGFQPFGFAGGVGDPRTQLTHFGNRDLDSLSGRWTLPDPLRFSGGTPNLFAYVHNDPVNVTDSTGRSDILDTPKDRLIVAGFLTLLPIGIVVAAAPEIAVAAIVFAASNPVITTEIGLIVGEAYYEYITGDNLPNNYGQPELPFGELSEELLKKTWKGTCPAP